MELANNGAPGHAKLSRDFGGGKTVVPQALQPFGAIKGPWRTGCAGTGSGQPLSDLADPLVRNAKLSGDRSDGSPGGQPFEDGAVAASAHLFGQFADGSVGHSPRSRRVMAAFSRL